MTTGAFSLLTNSKKEVLLVLRRDVPLWDLPGGRVEVPERPSQTAIRETHEETGLHIKLDGYQKRYIRPEIADTQYLFHSSTYQGDEIVSGPETRRLQWFPFSRLPILLIPHRRKQIYDYFHNVEMPEIVLPENRVILATHGIRNLLRKFNRSGNL
jgi:8-oxo-dGTP diphosphatase